jgi:hypothetical protein
LVNAVCAVQVLDPEQVHVYRDMTLGQYLDSNGYSEGFKYNYVLPMCAAVWSVPNATVSSFLQQYVTAPAATVNAAGWLGPTSAVLLSLAPGLHSFLFKSEVSALTFALLVSAVCTGPVGCSLCRLIPGLLQVLAFPVQMLVRFWVNHHLLDLVQRPCWRVVKGRSKSYVDKVLAGEVNDPRCHPSVGTVGDSPANLPDTLPAWTAPARACCQRVLMPGQGVG